MDNAENKGRRPADAGGKGLDKEHEVTHVETGEKRMITQREWRDKGKELRSQGWTRAEDEEVVEPTDEEEV